MTSEQAVVVALQALGHIVGDEALLQRFLRESGTDPSTLATMAGEPAFLAGVLDFLLANEANLLEFCTAGDLPPELPARARRALPGAAPDDA